MKIKKMKIKEIDITKISSLREAQDCLDKEQDKAIKISYAYKYAGQYKGIFYKYWLPDLEKIQKLDRCMDIVDKNIKKLNAYINKSEIS